MLKKKSELKKEFERRTTERKKREHEEYRLSKRTSLEKKLEEQANKLKLVGQVKNARRVFGNFGNCCFADIDNVQCSSRGHSY